MIIFLYSQYKLGIVEPKGQQFDRFCHVNVGVPQGSRLSCNAFNGIQDAILKRVSYTLLSSVKARRPDIAMNEIKKLNEVLAFADDTLISA